MKVVLVSNNIPPVIDGVGDFTYNISIEFEKSGIEVFIICRKDIPCKPIEKNVKVFPIVEKWNQSGFKEANKLMRQLNPDFIFIQYVPYAYSRLGLPIGMVPIVKNITEIGKTIIYFHETYIRINLFPIQTLLVSLVQRLILKKLSDFKLITITSIDRYVKQLENLGFSNIHLLPIPSNVEVKNINIDEIESLRMQVSPNNEKILITFGQRDFTLLYEAFNDILQERSDIVLIVLGNKNKKNIDNNKKIIITGELSRKEIYDYLSIANLFISFDPVSSGKGGTSNKSGSLSAGISIGLPLIGFKGDMNNSLLKKIPCLDLIPFERKAIIKSILERIDGGLCIRNKEFWEENLSLKVIAEYIEDKILNYKEQ